MKILGVSAGFTGGTNDAMVREALMGAQEAGAEVEFIRLLDLNLKACTGCCLCVTGKDGLMNGGSGMCVYKDDFAWFEDKFYDADGIIFSIPVFEKGVPGIFKLLQDKLGGPSHDIGMLKVSGFIRADMGEHAPAKGPDPRSQQPKLLAAICIGGSDWTVRAEADFKLFAMSGAHKVIDAQVYSWAKSIIVEDERIAQIHALGYSLAEAARDPENAKYIGDPGICPNCHSRLIVLSDDAALAECSVCGAKGTVAVTDGKVSFSFPPEQLQHVHTGIPGKMEHMKDIGENEGKLAQIKQGEEYGKRMARYDAFLKATKPPRES